MAAYLSEIGTYTISLIVDGLKHGLFDSTLSSIANLKRSSIRVCVMTPVNKANLEYLPLMKAFLAESGVDLWQLEVKNHSITPDEYLRVLEFIERSRTGYKDEKQMMKVQMFFEASHCMCSECGCVIRVKEDGNLCAI
jgi:MoaA/NifB/PqqE/SkfB family radical SAM enzyme